MKILAADGISPEGIGLLTDYEVDVRDKISHEELLDVLNRHRGVVMLSGYANELYDAKLQDWARYDTDMVVTSGVKRTETLWVKQGGAR